MRPGFSGIVPGSTEELVLIAFPALLIRSKIGFFALGVVMLLFIIASVIVLILSFDYSYTGACYTSGHQNSAGDIDFPLLGLYVCTFVLEILVVVIDCFFSLYRLFKSKKRS